MSKTHASQVRVAWSKVQRRACAVFLDALDQMPTPAGTRSLYEYAGALERFSSALKISPLPSSRHICNTSGLKLQNCNIPGPTGRKIHVKEPVASNPDLSSALESIKSSLNQDMTTPETDATTQGEDRDT